MTWGRALGALLSALGVAGAVWFLGVDAMFSLGWGLLTATVVLAAGLRGDIDDARWPPVDDRLTPRASEVARLSWAVNWASGTARPAVTRRFTALVESYLNNRGLSLHRAADAVAITALFGFDVHAALGPGDSDIAHLKRILQTIETTTKDDDDT